MIDCIGSLFEHIFNQREIVLDALERLPRDDLHKDMGIGWKSIHGLVVHMIETELYWIQQVLGNSHAEGTSHTSYDSIKDVRMAWRNASEKTRAFLSGLNENRLLRVMSVRWGETTVSFTVAKALLHVVIHEAHHCGQIVVLIRQLGYEPPRVDIL
jgi:uncharacterized damage-inducible protein DinB